jgi:superfamily I DNA/RNA helicase
MFIRPENWRPQGVNDLEPRAWEALRETGRSVCVTAGAGSGKTEFLAQKVTYLLQTALCPPPKRILAISFKRDAARNLAERVEKRCPSEQARRFGSMTFDGFAKNLLDRFRTAITPPFCPPANYRIVFPTRVDHESFLERYGFHGINANQFELAIARIPFPLDGTNVRGQEEFNAVCQYWRSQYSKHDEVSLTFPMVNRLVEWLLRENPTIRRALRITYPYVFLDEFQDTTTAQFDLLKTAFERSDTVFTAVGDDKQRIMGWAGAMPDAFSRFEAEFSARRISLLSNWRSHEDLVRIQHVIACRIDPDTECPVARAERNVDGSVASIWEFSSNEDERGKLAGWLNRAVQDQNIDPHDIAILVRMRANEVERELAPVLATHGLSLRNVARNVGDISIQDLLSEDLSKVFVPLLRLGATSKSPRHWNTAQQNMQFLEGVDLTDESRQQQLQTHLQSFVRQMRRTMKGLDPNQESAKRVAEQVLNFVGPSIMRQAFIAYQRQMDFDRVWKGFVLLLGECAEDANSWSEALDEFEGLGQIALMTIHKSKGLEFHTMIFYGLDNQTWWSLTPNRTEELNSFFVAFTRARQRAFFTLCTQRGQPVNWIEELLAPAGVHRIDGMAL